MLDVAKIKTFATDEASLSYAAFRVAKVSRVSSKYRDKCRDSPPLRRL